MTQPVTPQQHSESETYPRKVLFVAGAGRSGTSTMAGLMQRLGLLVPPPEVKADQTNPKGFAEPAWAVEHHQRLLADAGAQMGDARPEAWAETARIGAKESERVVTADWLAGHFEANPELVVKDPRLSWFIPMWQAAALRNSADPVFATMLRHPAQVIGSKQTYYKIGLGPSHLAASWLNMLLFTERATRESTRSFVRYADLLEDWTKTVMGVGEHLQLQHVLHARNEAIRECHRFIDPSLHRVQTDLSDLDLPPRLHDLCESAWAELNRLVEDDSSGRREALDQIRDAYVDLYEEAEAISKSSVVAATFQLRKERRRVVSTPGFPDPAPERPTRESVADLIPHDLRAKIPPGVRKGMRRALRRER